MRALTRQPKPFYLIFLIEIWERFGFYGVQALLIVFMVQQLGFSDARADKLFSAFAALAYLLPAVGGYVGDRLLGTKRTILLGALILALGYLLLSLPAFRSAHLLILPLAVVAVGNSLFKANPSSLLSKIYHSTTYNLDSGFTLYYMAINIGALLSMNLTPILSKYFGWQLAFLVCFVGLAVAVVNFIAMRSMVKAYGSVPDHQPLRMDYLLYVILAAVALIGICYWLLQSYQLMSWLLIIGAVTLILIYFILIGKAKEHERKGMLLFIVLFVQGIIFFVLYFQTPTALTLFALRNVQHSVLGIPIQPGQFQMFDSFWLMPMSLLLAAIYQALSNHQRDVSVPAKFSLGILVAGSAFLLLPFAGLFAHQGVISGMWLVLFYCLISISELLVSALGLSVAAQYVPQRFMGLTMGLWFLCISIANIIAGKVASIASIPKSISHDPVMSLPIYNHLFLEIGIITVAISAIMFSFVPVLKKLAHTQQATIIPAHLAEELVNDQSI